MAKKLTAQFDHFEDYTMIGLVCSLKDYKFVFFINKVLELDLKKYEDFQPDSGGPAYSWYCQKNKSELLTYYVIGNHHSERKLIPSQKSLDYFLLIKYCERSNVEKIIAKLRNIPNISGVFLIDMNKIKDMNTIIEMHELHELENVIRLEKKREQYKN